MNYTIEIPTLETITTLTAIAYQKGKKWILESLSREMTNNAHYGETCAVLKLDLCPYHFNPMDVYCVKETIQKMGYEVEYHPRRNEIIVSW